MIITFDGESGSGKTTLARETARKLGCAYIASGLIFRACAYLYNVTYGNIQAVRDMITEGRIRYVWNDGHASIFMNKSDITDDLKSEDIGNDTSRLAQYSEFYDFMNAMVRMVIDTSGVTDLVIDGRSVGKSLYPDAALKFYVTAAPEVRAQRRFDELKRIGVSSVTYDTILAQINERDTRDRARKHFPLRPESDTIVIDNGAGRIGEKITEITEHVHKGEQRLAKEVGGMRFL